MRQSVSQSIVHSPVHGRAQSPGFTRTLDNPERRATPSPCVDVKGLKAITAQRVITSSSSPSALLGIAAIDTEVTTLQKAALERIVAGLGEVSSSIACRFCCGTTLSSPDQVNVVYERSGRNWSSITFPGAEQADVKQLLGVFCCQFWRRWRRGDR